MPFNAGINELQFQNWMSKTLLGRGGEVLDDVLRMSMPEEDPTRGVILEPYPEPSDNKITEPYPEPSDTKITEPYPEPDNPYITEPYPEPQDTKITEPYPEESSHILKSEEGGKVWYHGGVRGLEGDIVGGMVTRSKEEAQRFADEVGGSVYEVPDEAVIPAKQGDTTNDGQSLGRAFRNYGYIKSVKAGQKGWNAKLSPTETK